MQLYNIKEWIAEDGLMGLTANDFKPAYGGGNLNTVNNDNGILYKTFYLFLKAMNNEEVHSGAYLETIYLTQHKTIRGLFHRHANKTTYINSHDNYVAMACGCILVGNTAIFKEIVAYGRKNWYILNDENPGKHLKLRRDHPSGAHQPHNWYMYLLAAGESPGFLTTLWNVSNLIHTGYLTKHFTHHDSHYLAWIRIEAILLILGEEGQKQITGWRKIVTKAVIKAYIKQMKRKSGGQAVYFDNFVEGHPLRILAGNIKF